MVFLVCTYPDLCLLLDTVSDEESAKLIHDTLVRLTDVLPPSLLLDALFLYVTVRKSLLAFRNSDVAAARDRRDGDEDEEMALYRRLASDAQAALLLEDLLRLRGSEVTAGPLDTSAWSADDVAQLSVLDLLEGTLRPQTAQSRRRQPALAQVGSLALLLRGLAPLWSFVFLCRALKLQRQRQASLIFNHPSVPVAVEGNHHDYELLLPVEWVRGRLARAGHRLQDILGALSKPPLPPPQHPVPFERYVRERFALPPPLSSTVLRRDHATAAITGTAAPRPLRLVINPAVTAPSENASRRQKNRRVDAIDKLVMQHGFEAMAGKPKQGAGAGGATGRLDIFASGADDKKRSHSEFVRNVFINFDIHVMALSGGVMGYGLGWLRGASPEVCLLYGIVLYLILFFVDLALLYIRITKEDLALAKRRREREKEIFGLSHDTERE